MEWCHHHTSVPGLPCRFLQRPTVCLLRLSFSRLGYRTQALLLLLHLSGRHLTRKPCSSTTTLRSSSRELVALNINNSNLGSRELLHTLLKPFAFRFSQLPKDEPTSTIKRNVSTPLTSVYSKVFRRHSRGPSLPILCLRPLPRNKSPFSGEKILIAIREEDGLPRGTQV
ncbi:hypothetical protein LZ30DRAFT_461824 [Colletotrichum cereale]|nr:hypothetical protein LZ30DRAFT_461824 [Colletotrichum cereale]